MEESIGELFFISPNGESEIIIVKKDEIEGLSQNVFEKVDKGFVAIQKIKSYWKNDEGQLELLEGFEPMVVIPYSVTLEQMDETLLISSKIMRMEHVSHFVIENYIKDQYGDDYDYYDYRNDNLKQRKDGKEHVDVFSSVLRCFFKEKLGMLSEDEKEMFSHYRNFSLEEILCGDCSQYLINHDNAGIISIYANRTYCSNSIKTYHGKEVARYYKLEGYSLGETDRYTDMVKKSSSIQMLLANGMVLVYIGEYEKLSEYQREQLFVILEEIQSLGENEDRGIRIMGQISLGGKETFFESLDQLYEIVSFDKKVVSKG